VNMPWEYWVLLGVLAALIAVATITLLAMVRVL